MLDRSADRAPRRAPQRYQDDHKTLKLLPVSVEVKGRIKVLLLVWAEFGLDVEFCFGFEF